MGFFDWSAPMWRVFGNRWSSKRIRGLANTLHAYVPAGGAVLDLGGGTGALSARLAKVMPATYTIVDRSPAMQRYVQARPEIQAVLGSAEAIPLADSSVDAVIVSDAFHHFRDQEVAVREIKRVLRPGGGLVMLEFDRRAWPVALVERLVDRNGHLFAPDELCAFMSERGVHGTSRRRSWMTFDYVGRASKT